MALLDDLVARVAALDTVARRDGGTRVVIGIAGVPGVGKSHLARLLVHRLAGRRDWADSSAAHVPMDGFHLADVELRRLGRLARKGAPDTFDPDGYAALLQRIRAGESVWAPDFDRSLEQPVAQSLPVTANTRVVVTEGNYLLLAQDSWQRARSACTEVWFCTAPEQLRIERLVARHVEFGKLSTDARAWVETVDELNARTIAATAATADLTVDTSRLPGAAGALAGMDGRPT